jgi:hypothetical protein
MSPTFLLKRFCWRKIFLRLSKCTIINEFPNEFPNCSEEEDEACKTRNFISADIGVPINGWRFDAADTHVRIIKARKNRVRATIARTLELSACRDNSAEPLLSAIEPDRDPVRE